MITWIYGSPGGLAGRVVSVGGFDGVHLGHRQIMQKMVDLASANELDVLVASFDPHPRAVLHGEQESRLTSIEERGTLLGEAGADGFVTLAFDREMAAMPAEVFVEQVLVKELSAKVVVVGHDHRFGKGRAGDVNVLRALGTDHGFEVVELPAFVSGQKAVSSSRIREDVLSGDVSSAAKLLGRFYSLTGRVVQGAGRGRTIGIPTANLNPVDSLKMIPGRGVYAVFVHIPDEPAVLQGMMNIGHRPTFDGVGLHLEVNILDWSGDLYGSEVRVEFVDRIRNEQKFDGPEALIRQLNEDRERCRALLQEVS